MRAEGSIPGNIGTLLGWLGAGEDVTSRDGSSSDSKSAPLKHWSFASVTDWFCSTSQRWVFTDLKGSCNTELRSDVDCTVKWCDVLTPPVESQNLQSGCVPSVRAGRAAVCRTARDGMVRFMLRFFPRATFERKTLESNRGAADWSSNTQYTH